MLLFTSQLDTHVGTLSQALVTQLVLRLCVSDKDLCVDESSNFFASLIMRIYGIAYKHAKLKITH